MWSLTRHEKLLVLWLCAAIVCGSLIRHYRHTAQFQKAQLTTETTTPAAPSVVEEKLPLNSSAERDDG